MKNIFSLVLSLFLFTAFSPAAEVETFYGAKSWKVSVLADENLPPTLNSRGDCRVVRSTGIIHCWDGDEWISQGGGGGSVEWGDISGDIGDQSDLDAALDLKAPLASPTFGTSARFGYATATTVPYLDSNKDLISSSITPTELGYLSGVTSSVQTQLGARLPLAGGTLSGNLLFSSGDIGTTSGSSPANVIGSSTVGYANSSTNYARFQSMGTNTPAILLKSGANSTYLWQQYLYTDGLLYSAWNSVDKFIWNLSTASMGFATDGTGTIGFAASQRPSSVYAKDAFGVGLSGALGASELAKFSSANKGVTFTNITSAPGTPTAGMLVYDTNNSVCGTNKFCGYDGTVWNAFH